MADDVQVANALVHMDGTKIMGRWADVTGENYRLSSQDHLLRYSQEFRGSFGHVALVGVTELIMPLKGKEPGDEIRLARNDPSSLRVRAEVFSISPLETIEVLVNAEVAHRWSPTGGSPRWEFETVVDLPGSGWIAARAIGPPSRYVGDAFAFAQTSPVHVVRDGAVFTSAEDARFLLESVEALWREVESRNRWHNPGEKEAYRDGVDRAREVYRSILRQHGDPP